MRFRPARGPAAHTFALATAIGAFACDAEAPGGARDSAAVPGPTLFADSLPVCDAVPFTVDTLATGLDVPWDIAFLPDGRALVTERGGRIRVLRDGVLDPRPWAVLDVAAGGEAGLLGIDIAPDFPETGHVYVAMTANARRGWFARVAGRVGRLVGLRPRHATVTRVVRLTDQDDWGVDPVTVAGDVPAGQIHVGGALRFSPDGRLYLGTGDAGIPDLARDPRAAAGAILELTGGESIVATGLRNVQGIAWQPRYATLFAADHGPTGLAIEQRRTGNDELNVIVQGGDYGWPVESGRAARPQYGTPRLVWRDAIAPAGLEFWAAPGEWQGDLFVSALAARDLIRVGFQSDGVPSCTRTLLNGAFGRIRAVRAGPDGALWVTTSNRDGRGAPGPDDDLLLRFRPQARKEEPATPVTGVAGSRQTAR